MKEIITGLLAYLIIFISKKFYNSFPKDLSKQQAFNADTKAIQQFSFTVNLDGAGDIVMFQYDYYYYYYHYYYYYYY